MARLQPGENAHIDNINHLVHLVKVGNADESSGALKELLDLFHPMLLGLYNKWSNYFGDKNHAIISFDFFIGECTYWFYHYTSDKYIVDGPATFNKFIKDHMDQRIRYIYETEIKYHSKLLFPDPYGDGDDRDALDNVINKYSNTVVAGPEVALIESIEADTEADAKSRIIGRIYELMDCDTFNERERTIFTDVVINGITHEDLGKRYCISRTRVTQILAKTKKKLYKKIEEDPLIWSLIGDANITITNPKLME